MGKAPIMHLQVEWMSDEPARTCVGVAEKFTPRKTVIQEIIDAPVEKSSLKSRVGDKKKRAYYDKFVSMKTTVNLEESDFLKIPFKLEKIEEAEDKFKVYTFLVEEKVDPNS